MASEMAQGSMTITRASPRPMKSSLRISATGKDSRMVPPTTATVQITVRWNELQNSGSSNRSWKCARPMKSRSWPNRLTSWTEVLIRS